MYSDILLLTIAGRMKSHSQLAELGRYWMLLVFWVVIAVAAAPAQQPDAPSAAKAGASEQPDVAANAAYPPDETTEVMFPHFKDTRFWLSGQANFIFQTHPQFHAPYSGPNSLSPNYEKATSRVMTLYTGVRLNDSTEILVDIEEAGGAAPSTGLGLACPPGPVILRIPSLYQTPFPGLGQIAEDVALVPKEA